MAFDEGLAERIRDTLDSVAGVTERKMFGGLAFMLHGNMFVGVIGSMLMARVGPEQYTAALRHPHAREMNFTGRPMGSGANGQMCPTSFVPTTGILRSGGR